MKINFEKIKSETGCEFDNIEQLYFYCVRLIEFLFVHNKNYNKKQYKKIYLLLNFINAVEF